MKPEMKDKTVKLGAVELRYQERAGFTPTKILNALKPGEAACLTIANVEGVLWIRHVGV